MGAIKCLLANPDLGRTNPPTLKGNCIAIPSFTLTTSPASMT